VEGIGCSGKSTQCNALVQNLTAAGVAAEGWSTPDWGTPTGQIIRQIANMDIDVNPRARHFLLAANK